MNKLKASLIFCIVVTLLATSIISALAAPLDLAERVKVVINNKTGFAVTLSLTGPEKTTLKVGVGKNNFELLPGTYKYTYQQCGKNSGTFSVKKAGDTLTLPKCTNIGEDEVRVVIVNQTDGTLYFVFSGRANYRFTVPPGKTKVMMGVGKYTYTATGNACGVAVNQQGNLNVKGALNWTWTCAKD